MSNKNGKKKCKLDDEYDRISNGKALRKNLVQYIVQGNMKREKRKEKS